MKTALITLGIALTISFMPSNNLFAANIYVDNTLSSDCMSGNYSISNRQCNGSDGVAYNIIQEAVNVVAAGDTIYMRGGAYAEHINIPGDKDGNANAWITLASYPGEWAILNPNYDRGSNYDAYVIRYKGGGYGPTYWKFSRFEVTGGGQVGGAKGGGILFDTAHHLTFEYLYIHDNYSNNSNNGAGIAIFNDGGGTGHHITIKYNWLANNACSSGDNCANIVLMSTYNQNPGSEDINIARSRNEIKYNLIEGSNHGIKSKGPTAFLSLSNTGTDVRYKDYGDKIHHNIVRDYRETGIIAAQDFIQVYNNILANSSTKRGINLGYARGYPREPFYAVAYNNHLINTNITSGLARDHTLYNPPLHPNSYFYNNIIEDYGSVTNAHNDMNIFFSWSQYNENDLDWSTVTIENNLITGKSSNDSSAINVVGNSNDQSVDYLKSKGYSNVFYNTISSSGLRNNYKVNGDFSVGSGKNIRNGGIGGAHPYLPGVTIPSYVGAVNPDDDAWVDGVTTFATMVGNIPINLKNGSGDPSWLVGVGVAPNIPSAITNLKVP